MYFQPKLVLLLEKQVLKRERENLKWSTIRLSIQIRPGKMVNGSSMLFGDKPVSYRLVWRVKKRIIESLLYNLYSFFSIHCYNRRTIGRFDTIAQVHT